MPLKTSGELSFTEIASEFFVTAPYRLSDFYRGSLAVPDTDLNIGVPTSGLISFSDFYGTAYAIPPDIPAGAIVFYSGETVPSGWQEYTAAEGRFVKGTASTAQIGTITEGSMPQGTPQSGSSGTAGAHTGGTFNAGDMGATSGSVSGYPINSSTPANHDHVVASISSTTIGADVPMPAYKRFKMIKSLSTTQTIPANSLIMSQLRPSPAWTAENGFSENTYIMAGTGADASTAVTKNYTSTSGSNGAHSHKTASTSRYYNAGVRQSVYADAVSGQHTHTNINVGVRVNKIKSICLNLWRSVQTTIASNNAIFMFDGDLNNLPQDWYVCNGLNGTVDLSDRFIQIGGSGGVVHGVKEDNSEIRITYGSLPSQSVPHSHRQDAQFITYQTFRASLYHADQGWSHSHTAPAVLTRTGNWYNPPAINIGFIQYIKDNANISTVTVTQNTTAINENSAVTITVNHTNYPIGTIIYWDTEAIVGTLENNEFTDGALSGSVTIASVNSSFALSRTPRNDLREEGLEQFRIRFFSNSARTIQIGASQPITINDTSLPEYVIRVLNTDGVETVTVNEGDIVTFELLTSVLTAGTTVYWSTTNEGSPLNVNSTDFEDNTLTGSVVLQATTGPYRRALVARTLKKDQNTDIFQEQFRLQFRTTSTAGTIRATSNYVLVNDTSKTPGYSFVGLTLSGTNESNTSFTHEIEATNVPDNGETVYWQIVGYDAGTGETTTVDGDFLEGNTGSFLVAGPATDKKTVTFTLRTNADTRTEPVEYYLLRLRRGNATTGELLAEQTMTMNVPSSSNASYSLTVSASTPSPINWGQSITFVTSVLSGSHAANTVYYYKIVGWSTDDFSTAEIQRVAKGTSTTNTSITVNTRSSFSKAGKNYTLELYNDDPASGRGVLMASRSFSVNTVSINSLAPNVTSVNEGQTVTFTIGTSGITNGTTLYWNLDFMSSSASGDFSATQGSATVNSNSGTFSVTLTNDASTEGSETFRARIYSDVSRTNLLSTSSTVTINDTSLAPVINSLTPSVTSVNEGSSVSFTAAGANHTSNTTYYYRLVATSGSFNTNDITATSFDGTLTYTSASQSGSAVVTLVNDFTTEGVERFRMDLYSNSTRTNLVRSSSEVTVNDTSLSPTYSFGTIPTSINEGSSGTFNVTTTNVPNTTTLYWTVSNVTTAAADFSSTSGSFQISNNAGSFTVTTTADATTEGAETFRVQIRTSSTTGTLQATSNLVTINDTSLTPTYAFGTIPTSINEGSSGTFRVNTTNVPNGTTLYWTVRNVTTAAADFSATSGSFSITSNTGTFTVTPTADGATEGAETFQVEVRTGSITGTVRATSANVTVNDTSTTAPGQALFEVTTATTTRVTTWVCPAGVTSISVVCVGGGGGGRSGSGTGTVRSGGGGGGGSLSYRNNITVTPGSSYTVQIGRAGNGVAGTGTGAAGAGGQSYFFTASTVAANGGGGGSGSAGTWAGGAGGARVTTTGVTSYAGGVGGGGQNNTKAGGGGAAGYAGVGGVGGGRAPTANTNNNATAGAGGGGGGGGFSTAVGTSIFGGHGGGVRALGQESNGVAGSNSTTGNAGDGSRVGAGCYGGGGAGGNATSVQTVRQNGQPGVVRLMWPGNLRSYPSTRTANE
jgi:hypothetical protein